MNSFISTTENRPTINKSSSNTCCRDDGIRTHAMFKVVHKTRFLTWYSYHFQCFRKLNSWISPSRHFPPRHSFYRALSKFWATSLFAILLVSECIATLLKQLWNSTSQCCTPNRHRTCTTITGHQIFLLLYVTIANTAVSHCFKCLLQLMLL